MPTIDSRISESAGFEEDRSTPDDSLGSIQSASTGSVDDRSDDSVDTDRPENTVTLGRYQLQGELGRGGMGAVYRARDTELDRDVALKVLLAGALAGDRSRKRFMREARAVARLRHANIVQIYDIGVHEDVAFFTMELIEGPSLAVRMSDGKLPTHQAAAIVGTLARALAYAHEHGLVHRDVKPGNVLLDSTVADGPRGADSKTGVRAGLSELGRPVLTDFGLVKDADAQTAELTRGGAFLGTPAYMAPEQIRGDNDAIGPHTDQYALGVMLWELASGKRLHSGANPVEIARKLAHHEPSGLGDRSVPTPLRRICEKAMARGPRERYADCGAFADDLVRFLSGEPVHAASRGPLWHARRFVSRYRRALALLSLVALTAAVVVWALGALAGWRAERAENARQFAAEQRRTAMQTRIDALTRGAGELDEQAMAEADRVFAGFTKLEDNAETRSLARAWLDRAALLKRQLRSGTSAASDDRTRAARSAYATAYGLSGTRKEQVPALLGLATLFRADHDWPALRSALQTLAQRAPDARSHPVARKLRRDLALSERRLSDAAAFAGDLSRSDEWPEANLLAHLARATRTPHRTRTAALWDIDRDGAPELVFVGDGQTSLTVTGLDDASLPVRTHLAVPGASRPIKAVRPLVRPATEPPALLVLEAGHRSRIVGLVDARLKLASVPPPGYFFGAASGDLDGDGAVEHYGALLKKIVSFTARADGSFAVEDALPLDRRSSSYVGDLAIADLDRDGRPELIAVTYDWGAYDIRAYRAAEPGLELVARHRLGRAVQVELVRAPGEVRAAVIQRHHPAIPLNRRVFAADEPHSEARGIHVLALTPSGWQPRTSVPSERMLPRLRGRSGSQMNSVKNRLLSGDLDGDGLDDLVASYESTWMVIYHQRADGTFGELVIDGVVPLAIRDIDGDSAAELIVSTADPDARVWVLGVGDEQVPPVAPAADEPTEHSAVSGDYLATWSATASTEVEPALRADWRRAEDLAAMGLQSLAAQRFEQIALRATGTATEARAFFRAGAAMEATARESRRVELSARTPLSDASALYRRAAAVANKSPARSLRVLHSRAWDAALRCHLAESRHDAALQAARTRLALPEPPAGLRELVDRLESQMAASSVVLDFAAGLDERWRVHRPFDVRIERSARGLRMRTVGDGPVLSLSLRRTTGPSRVSLDVSAERTDWAGVFYLALVPDGQWPESFRSLDRVRVFQWWTMGGAQVYHQRIACGPNPPYKLLGAAGMASGRRRQLTWELSTADRSEHCEFKIGERVVSGPAFRSNREIPESVTLVIGGSATNDKIATVESVLHRLELVGFEIASVEPMPLARAHHALALGRPDRALATLGAAKEISPGSSVAAAVARATALADLQRAVEANRVLAAALNRDPDLDGLFVPIMRHHLDSFEPAVRAVLGARYYPEFSAVHFSAVSQHPDEERGLMPITTYLNGLETVAFETFSEPDDTGSHIGLLTWRGAAWRKRDRAVLSHRDLVRAQELGRYLLAVFADTASREYRAGVRHLIAFAGLNLAMIYVEWGERDRAVSTLLDALAVSPEPEIFGDQIAVQEQLQPLRTHPRWPEIWRARKIGEWPDVSAGDRSGR